MIMAPLGTTVSYSLIIVLGLVLSSSFLLEGAEGGRPPTRVRKTNIRVNPPRLKDLVSVRNEWYKKPGDKKKRLRTEIDTPGHKLTLKIPDPPVILHEVLEYWPYNRVYYTSVLGIINYIHKILWIVYKIAWIFIDMFIILVKILFQVTQIGKLKHSYDELNKPNPFDFDHHKHPNKYHDIHDYY